MGGKKKTGGKQIVVSQAETDSSAVTDYSKYQRAKSNKSKINYAELKLAHTVASSAGDAPESGKRKKQKTDKKSKPAKKSASAQKDSLPEKTGKARKAADAPRRQSQSEQAEVSAEKRYNDALGSEDHYSSVIEKYYLKHPEAKRKGGSRTRSTIRTRGGRKRLNSAQKNSRSVAEIARENKNLPLVQERAKNIADGSARGVVPSRVANHRIVTQRKKTSGALNVLIIFVMLVFICGVCMAVFFNVKTIKVTGENPYTEEIVLKKCSIKKGDNILFLNTSRLEEKIVSELPYIETCTVRRRLPSTVTITLTPAELLGVAEVDENTWSVLSVNGKIVETDTNLASVSPSDALGPYTYTPLYSSAGQIAKDKEIPELKGLYVKNHVADRHISEDAMEIINCFAALSAGAKTYDLRLTEISLVKDSYEVRYDDRIRIIFGKEVDKKTASHRFHEIHFLIFDKEAIAEDSRGEIRFHENRTFFRPEYDISEEDLERIVREREEANRKRLLRIGEIFASTGKKWYDGKLASD